MKDYEVIKLGTINHNNIYSKLKKLEIDLKTNYSIDRNIPVHIIVPKKFLSLIISSPEFIIKNNQDFDRIGIGHLKIILSDIDRIRFNECTIAFNKALLVDYNIVLEFDYDISEVGALLREIEVYKDYIELLENKEEN